MNNLSLIEWYMAILGKEVRETWNTFKIDGLY